MAKRQTDPDPALRYHYDRGERLSRADAPDPSRRDTRGVFRGNRSLMILLVDILLISLLFLTYRYLLYSPPNQARLGGYDLVLDGLSVGDRVFAGLSVEKVRDDAPEGRIFARFFVESAEVRESGTLPTRGDETVYVAGTLYVSDAGGELVAEVEIAGKIKTLVKRLRQGDD